MMSHVCVFVKFTKCGKISFLKEFKMLLFKWVSFHKSKKKIFQNEIPSFQNRISYS